MENIRKQQELSSYEIQACGGNERSIANLVAKKALGYNELMNSLENLNSVIQQNDCHKRYNVFNYSFARSVSTKPKKKKKSQDSVSNAQLEKKPSKVVSEQNSQILDIDFDGLDISKYKRSHRMLRTLAHRGNTKIIEEQLPHVRIKKNSMRKSESQKIIGNGNSITRYVKMPLFPAVASRLIKSDPIGFKKKGIIPKIEIETNLEEENTEKTIETRSNKTKNTDLNDSSGLFNYMKVFPLSARNFGRSVISPKFDKEIHITKRVAIGSFDLPMLMGKKK